jgi:integrase
VHRLEPLGFHLGILGSASRASRSPELTFHGLRHSAASLAGGADISTVSKLVGHASIAITAYVYAHLVAAVGQRAVDGAANLIAHTVRTQQAVSG